MASWRSSSGRTRPRRRHPEGDSRANGESKARNSAMAARSVTGSRPAATSRSTRSGCRARVAFSPMALANRSTDCGVGGANRDSSRPSPGVPTSRMGSGQRVLGQRGHAEQHQPLDPVRVGQRVPQRPHPAPRVADQRGGVQLEGVEEPVQPGDRALAVAGCREVDRVAQPHPGPVGGDRADPMELVQQRQQEPRRVPGAVEEHDRRPRALLQEMDPIAGATSTWRLRTDAPASRRSYTWRISAEWGCWVRACGRLLIGASSLEPASGLDARGRPAGRRRGNPPIQGRAARGEFPASGG